MPSAAPSSPSQKKTVTLFTTIQGHGSLCEAIKSTLSEHYKTPVFFDRNRFFSIYVLIYQFFPAFFQLPYMLSGAPFFQSILKSYFTHIYIKKIRTFFDTHHPSLCISTYFMYNPALEKLCRERGIPLLNIIPDPRSIHPLVVSPAAINFTFDHDVLIECEQRFPGLNFIETGWFVRPEFEQSIRKEEARKKLKLDAKLFTIVMSLGSEGTEKTLNIIKNLKEVPSSVQVVVACGRNLQLFNEVQRLATHFDQAKSLCTLIPVHFTNEMYLYFFAADLIVGKAGPNSIFEATAAQRPFFAVTHIDGQETGNLQMIKQYQLGYVEEDPARASALIRNIIAHPEKMQQFEEPLLKLARYNHAAHTKLLQVVKMLLK